MSGAEAPQSAPLHAQARRGEGAPLVLLHGFGGEHMAWVPIVQRLPKDRATIAYDLPGHGRSLDAPGAGRAGAMAKGVLADLDARGIERFHIAGHSMGGAVATLIAMRAPERVASLTLLAPGGFGPEIAHDVLRGWGAAAQRLAIARALQRMTAPDFRYGAFEIGRIETTRRRSGQVPALRAIAESLADGEGRQGEIPRDAIRALAVPTTLLWGTADPILPAHHADGLDDALHIIRIEGAGHMLIDERPRDVASAIEAAINAGGGRGSDDAAG